jgi:hypothetical protein
MSGYVTGDEPDDDWLRRIDEAEKVPARSIKLGNRWYSYDSTPVAIPFAMMANLAQNYRREYEKQYIAREKTGLDPKVAAAVTTMARGATSAAFHNFFLENVLEMGTALLGTDRTATPDRIAYALASPLVTRHTPAVASWIARNGDHFERDTRGEGVGERLINLGKSRLPGYRDDLPIRTDVRGRDIEQRQPYGAGLIAYARSVGNPEFDPMFRVLDHYDVRLEVDRKEISAPGRVDARFDLTQSEKRAWQEHYGSYVREELAKTYNNPSFNQIRNVAPGQNAAESLANRQKQDLERAVARAASRADQDIITGFGTSQFQRNLVIEDRIRKARERRATSIIGPP